MVGLREIREATNDASSSRRANVNVIMLSDSADCVSSAFQSLRARAAELVPTWRSPQHSGVAGRGTRMLSRRRFHPRKPTTYEST